jgi:DNA-binding IclR family transcriptional regulator
MRCRDDGILLTAGDYMPGIWAASAPVVNHEHKLVGILSIIGLVDVLSEDERDAATRVMKDVGRKTEMSHASSP